MSFAGTITGANSGLAEKASDNILAPDQLLDAAPFSLFTSDEDGKAHTLRWGEPRKIRRVVIELPQDGNVPKPDKIRLQYWHNSWNGRSDRILAESSTGGEGWTEIDDWTKGQWKDVDTNLQIDGNKLTFTFNSTGAKEYVNLGETGVGYRKTLKIRLFSDQSISKPVRFQAYTDAVCRELTIRILLGKPAKPSVKIDGDDQGHLEIFNGSIVALRSMNGSSITIKDNFNWILPSGLQGGMEADVIIAVDPVDERYDRTIVTVRSKHRPVSFAADEIARSERILIDDLGVLVVRGDDTITLEGYRVLRKEFPGKTVYNRVFDQEEQTLSGAWNGMPVRRPMEFVHGLPGNRNVMQQYPNGDLLITGVPHWFLRPASPKDTDRKDWGGDMLEVRFGFPDSKRRVGRELHDEYLRPTMVIHNSGVMLRGGRELQDGYLPLLRTWWQDDAIYYEQKTVMDKLDSNLNDIQVDDPTLLLMRVRIVNTSRLETAQAKLLFASNPECMPYGSTLVDPHEDEKLIIEGNRAMAHSDNKERFRFLVETGGQGRFAQEGPYLRWSLELKPGDSHELFFAVPSITLNRDDEIEALVKRDFDADCQRICAFWENWTKQSTQINTPEPWLNDFYKTHIRHMLVNCIKEPGSNHLLPHAGTFRYGVYGSESIMMVSDLDRRGYHDLAQHCYDSWLDYQGTVMLPGNFKSKDGLFYGVNKHESGGYNKHHGCIMWGMADHWWYTRDRKWFERSAPKLIKACDWVTRERQATMTLNPDGNRVIEYGFLPTGALEDVQDFWYWLATNSATVWGFDNLAAALADYGHPEANRLLTEAKAYHDDVIAGLTESRVRAVVVRLRDGTYVPKFPSRLYERGRSHGWIRETLEGSILLPVVGLVEPESIQTEWIVKDYEDNLYISDRYGYSIPDFENFWFSRGGFSLQALLLEGPIPYLLRDEVKHFLRGYFNSFAAEFDPQVRMCSEGCNPELGYPTGDHFKTSDEAQSTYWLRLMFVHENGKDLFLGQAIPRYWLSDGNNIGIERAATHFGPLSFKIKSASNQGQITVVLNPPERYSPKNIYVRLRHPHSKPIQSVKVNGKQYANFDANKEWIILSGTVQGVQELIALY